MKFFLILFFIFIFPVYSYPLLQPYLNYKTIESENFYIHFPKDYQKIAYYFLSTAEKIHNELSPQYKDNHKKTHFVIIIQQDITNAYTSVYGLDLILFYLHPPLSGEFSNYENWLYQLILHEYTHILTLRNYSGFSNYLFRFLFGIPPNLSLPNGLLEGISVIEESYKKEIGRLWDSNTNSILRQQIFYNKIPSFEEIMGGSYFWPLGKIPYLYGARYLNHIIEEENKEKFIQVFNSKSLPIFLRSRFYSSNLKNPEDYYNNFIKKEYNFLKKWITKKTEKPITPYEQITYNGGYKDFLKVSQNNLFYFEKSSYRSSGIYNLDQRLFYKADSIFDFSIYDNSFITSEIISNGNFYKTFLYWDGNEILFYDNPTINTKSKLFPFIYNDNFYYIEIEDLKYKIIQSKFEKDSFGNIILKNFETLFEGNPLDLIQYPIIRNSNIYFILKKNNSLNHTIIECEIISKKCNKILEIPFTITTLNFDSINEEILFSSDLDGNFEIYSYNLKYKKVKKLTNSFLSLKYPVLWKSYLYAIGETYNGMNIFRIPKEFLLNQEVSEYFFRFHNSEDTIQDKEIVFSENNYKIQKYNLKYFQFFLDGVLTSSNSNFAFQISGLDPLKRHLLNLGAGYLNPYTLYFITYKYQRFIPVISLSYTKTNPFHSDKNCYPSLNQFLKSYLCKIYYGFENYYFSFEYPYNFRLVRTSYTIGISHKKNRNLNANSYYFSNYNTLNQNSIFFYLNISYFDFYYYSISPEKGFRFQFRIEYFPSYWNFISLSGNQKISYDYTNFSSRIEIFVPWFIKNHVPYISFFINRNIGKDRDLIQYRLSLYQKGLAIEESSYGKSNAVLGFEYRFPVLYSSKRILWILPEIGIHWISLAPFYEMGKSFDKFLNEKSKIFYSKGLRSDWKVYMFYLPFFIHFIYAKGTEEQFSFSFSFQTDFHIQTLQQKPHPEYLPQTFYYK